MREFCCPFRTINWILWHKAFESPNEDERDLNFHFSKGSLYKVLWESFPSLCISVSYANTMCEISVILQFRTW